MQNGPPPIAGEEPSAALSEQCVGIVMWFIQKEALRGIVRLCRVAGQRWSFLRSLACEPARVLHGTMHLMRYPRADLPFVPTGGA